MADHNVIEAREDEDEDEDQDEDEDEVDAEEIAAALVAAAHLQPAVRAVNFNNEDGNGNNGQNMNANNIGRDQDMDGDGDDIVMNAGGVDAEALLALVIGEVAELRRRGAVRRRSSLAWRQEQADIRSKPAFEFLQAVCESGDVLRRVVCDVALERTTASDVPMAPVCIH